MTTLKAQQHQLTSFVRDPENHAGPGDVEPRRLKIYKELFFNNIEGFLSAGFPVCRTLYSDTHWETLVRDFMREHYCSSPYFMEIAEEFITYLSEQRRAAEFDPPFLLELAHYEWLELVLDVSEQELGPKPDAINVLDDAISLSPLALNVAYRYPVHMIGHDFQPQEPSEEPTYIVVFRNRQDSIEFIALNAMTARLLALLDEASGASSGRHVLGILAEEAGIAEDSILNFGAETIERLYLQDVIVANSL
ncbi:MAG: HvfC family RiPP maturation protein [Spongiibacteraceae bacterium]